MTPGATLTYTAPMTRPNPFVPQPGTVCLGLLLIAACALAGCGQTGALYLPSDAPESTPVNEAEADDTNDDNS